MCEPDSPTVEAPPEEVTITGIAQQEAWVTKGWPGVEQVRPDVWSVPVPVPGNPIRYTLCYLLFGRDELVVVDPGWDSDAGWQALAAGLQAAGASTAAVTGIVLTHVHPDHHGLTARLVVSSGAWVAMHPAERDTLRVYASSPATRGRDDAAWMAGHGVPPAAAEGMAVPEAAYAEFRSMPEPDLLLADGDLIALAGRRVRAVWTPGHTPGHLCLHDEDNEVMLTGDHVLPRITPNVGLQPHTAGPPLGPYLESLQRMAGFDSAEVFPAHEWRFRGLALRVEQLIEHHRQRCQEIVGVLESEGPSDCWQVTERLTWSRGWAAVVGLQRRAAVAETVAHLLLLVEQGRVSGYRSTDRAATVYAVTAEGAGLSRGSTSPGMDQLN